VTTRTLFCKQCLSPLNLFLDNLADVEIVSDGFTSYLVMFIIVLTWLKRVLVSISKQKRYLAARMRDMVTGLLR
jgi:hypothetical protein